MPVRSRTSPLRTLVASETIERVVDPHTSTLFIELARARLPAKCTQRVPDNASPIMLHCAIREASDTCCYTGDPPVAGLWSSKHVGGRVVEGGWLPAVTIRCRRRR